MPYPPSVDIDAGVEAMRAWIASRDWGGLESSFAEDCRRLDPEAAAAVSSVDLSLYTSELADSINALGTQLGKTTAAVYWEFDVDNGWSSAFFECLSYESESVGDDDWASNFDPSKVHSGPAMPELAALLATTWRGNAADEARNLHLLACTMAAFGRASARWNPDVPLCAGFHDQWIVFRVVAGPGDIGGH